MRVPLDIPPAGLTYIHLKTVSRQLVPRLRDKSQLPNNAINIDRTYHSLSVSTLKWSDSGPHSGSIGLL